MLRANIDEIIKNTPYSEPVGGFLLGFSSTIIGFASLFVLLLVLYDYYRFNNNSIIMKSYKYLMNENDFILPLYHKTHKYEENVVEVTEKPDLSSFVIPALQIDQIGFPISSPLNGIGCEPQVSSSGLKRRTVSMNNFGISGAVAPSPTPTRIISPFKHDVPEVVQPV